MLRKVDWDYNNKWCDHCQQRIGKLPKNNELVIVNDGFGKYYIFDTWKCAIEHCRQHKIFEGCGLHDAEEVIRLEDVIRRKPNWHISRTSIIILQKCVNDLTKENKK